VIGNVTQLATLPLRIALRVAGEVIRTASGLVGGGSGDGGSSPNESRQNGAAAPPPVRPREPVRWDDDPVREERPPRTRQAERPAVQEPAAARDEPREPAAPRDAPTPAPAAEDHVSEEPVLVEEVADPGAEDGAGPEISVGEPWPSYASMSATEVIARLEDADPAAVAVARLYEHANRARKTVLAAADRRLKLLGS
jgi:hypothetical protein